MKTGEVNSKSSPMPTGNRLIERRTLRDGRGIDVFRRYGRWRFDTISVLPGILTPPVLDRLVVTGGAMIVYLHIGPSGDETPERLAAGMKALDEVVKQIPEQVKAITKRKKELGDKPFGLAKDQLYTMLQEAEALQKKAREAAAEAQEADEEPDTPVLLTAKGLDVSRLTDTQLSDNQFYLLFPNFS